MGSALVFWRDCRYWRSSRLAGEWIVARNVSDGFVFQQVGGRTIPLGALAPSSHVGGGVQEANGGGEMRRVALRRARG